MFCYLQIKITKNSQNIYRLKEFSLKAVWEFCLFHILVLIDKKTEKKLNVYNLSEQTPLYRDEFSVKSVS